jgi:hypothetical protein
VVDHWQAQADQLYWWDWMIASVLIREAEQFRDGGSQSEK